MLIKKVVYWELEPGFLDFIEQNPNSIFLFENIEMFHPEEKLSNVILIPVFQRPNHLWHDNEKEQAIKAIDEAFDKIPKGKKIYIPNDGIGVELGKKTFLIYHHLNYRIKQLEEQFLQVLDDGTITEYNNTNLLTN